MHVIKRLDPTRDELDAAKMKMIKTAYEVEGATEHLRIEEAAEEAAAARAAPRTIPGLGRLVAVMPDRDYFRLGEKYDKEEIHSKEFLRWFQKKMPEMKAGNI